MGHGTAVAGIIAASSNNGVGTAGVSWGARIMPVKVLDYNGEGYVSDILEGIVWAAEHGADIINMSLGGSTSSKVVRNDYQAAVDYAYSLGVTTVVAAGNDSEYLDPADSVYYLPAELNHVIAVGSVNQSNYYCSTANNCGYTSGWGPLLDVMAPGTNISTTALGGGYTTTFNGTSSATPFVAGVAALVLSADPALTPDEVEARITASAFPLARKEWESRNDDYGWGLVDAYAAIRPVPANDNYANAIVITSTPFTHETDTVNATLAKNDPTSNCGTAKNSDSVWYKFTPSVKGILSITTAGSDYDTVVEVWKGSPGSFTSVTCTPNPGDTIEITLSANTTYSIEVTDRDSAPGGGELQFSLDFVPTPTPGVPGSPSPASGSAVPSDQPVFSWAPSANGYQYRIQLNTSTDFSSPLYDVTLDAGFTAYAPPAPLAQRTWYWRVQAISDRGITSAWSTKWSVVVDTTPPNTPTLGTPKDLAATPDTTPAFGWTSVTGAKRYTVEVAADTDFTAIRVTGTPTTNAFTVPNAGALGYGTYYWRVKAADAAGNESGWSAVRSFTVTILKTPANQALTQDTTPTFTWAAVTGALQYEFVLAADEGFTNVVATRTQTGTSYTVPVQAVGHYYWRVRALTSGLWTDWMPGWRLTITGAPPAVPTLTGPANNFRTNTEPISLAWNAVSGAASYEIQIDTAYSFSTPDYLLSATGANYDLTELSADGKVYWRVRALNEMGAASGWSGYRAIVVDTTPPKAPVLSSPKNAGSSRGMPTFSWEAVSGANRYQLEYDDNADFSSPLYTSEALTVTSFKPPTSDLGLIYWHARARDAAGNWGPWSAGRALTVKPPLPAAPVLASPVKDSSVATTRVTFDWQDVAGALKYEIQIDNNDTFASPEYTNAELGASEVNLYLPPMRYYWRVRAMNVIGEPGAWSSGWKVKLVGAPDVTPPTAPVVGGSHTAGVASADNTMDITWLAADDGAGSGVAGYVFHLDSDPNPTTATALTGDATVLGITTGTLADGTYYFHLRACDEAGNCSADEVHGPYVIDVAAPGAPTGLASATHTVDVASAVLEIGVSWTAADDGAGSGVLGYSVVWDNLADTEPDLVIDRDVTEPLGVTSPTLAAGTWWFHVRAIDWAGNGSATAHLGPFILE